MTKGEKRLHYKNTKIHRLEKGLLCQGGDITRGDGSGGESIYGKPFNDEKEGLKLKFDTSGLLAMANSGKNSNTSQFFITFTQIPRLNGKHVIFGKVIEGEDVLQRIQQLSNDSQNTLQILIADCGQL